VFHCCTENLHKEAFKIKLIKIPQNERFYSSEKMFKRFQAAEGYSSSCSKFPNNTLF